MSITKNHDLETRVLIDLCERIARMNNKQHRRNSPH